MKNILLTVTLAFLYYITGKISLTLLDGHNIVNIGVFAAEGVALAFVLFFGKRVWIGIFLGQFVLAYLNNMGFFVSMLIGLINASEAVLAYNLFSKFRLNKDLSTTKDIIGFVLIVLFILQPYSAILSNIILYITDLTYNSFFISTFSWWFGNVMGQLLITPFLVLLFYNYKSINFKDMLLYGVIVALYVYILEIVLNINNSFLLVTLTLPILIYIIATKGMLFGTFISIVIAMIASLSIYLEVGAFYTDDSFENALNYNLFVLAHIAIGLTMGVLFRERNRYEDELKSRIDKEVKKNQEQQLLMLQQSRLAQMGEMISMIAHQWRQPLNNLSLINQLLISKYKKKKLDDSAIEYFKINSKKQIDLMSKTIDDFRNFFKPQKLKSEFSINSAIKDTLEMLNSVFTNNNIEIDFKADKDYSIKSYQSSFIQVVLNILNNAKDALIENKEDNRKISIKIKESEDSIILEISDNAGGIKKDIIDKIFDPYFSTKGKNGTGLGLYMTKVIVQDHLKGSISVSNKDDGAVFKIDISKKEG